jgi:hypothetical protein
MNEMIKRGMIALEELENPNLSIVRRLCDNGTMQGEMRDVPRPEAEMEAIVRTVIATMREPTDAMLMAMCGSDVLADLYRRDWQMAIDEALK